MTLTPEDKQWIESRLNARLESLETHFLEQLEKAETKLLSAFHGWAEPVNVRMRSHAADIRAIQVDLEELQDRVEKLEKRKQ